MGQFHRKFDLIPNFIRYFKDCIGAIDGTHIPAKVSENMIIPFRDRSGKISQNVLAACGFDLLFSYVLPDWEGSAHNASCIGIGFSGS